MRVDYYWILAAVINLVLFLLHSQAYKSAGCSLRMGWTAITIGAGFGYVLADFPEWIYGLSNDYSKLWVAIVIWITGAVMILVSHKIRAGTIKQ
jgi:cyanate permease